MAIKGGSRSRASADEEDLVPPRGVRGRVEYQTGGSGERDIDEAR